MSRDKKITAGDDVDSRCLKCKAVTNHTIVAMTDDTIAKVQCNSCGARHKYRPPVEEKKKAAAVRRRRDGVVTSSTPKAAKAKKTKKTTKKAEQWAAEFDALMESKDEASAIPYAMDATLSAGDLVKHHIFGFGVVTVMKPPNKAEIAFREHGVKLMACKLA